MKINDMYLNNKLVGKYLEIDINKYDIKLIYTEKAKKLDEFVKSNGALAGINGGLFGKNGPVGILKDSNGVVKGEGDSTVPYILYKSNTLSTDWNIDIPTLKNNYDWARSAAFYGFLVDGQYGEHTLIPDVKDGIKLKECRSMIGQKTNGNIILAASTENLNGKEQADILISLGCTIGLNLDGGRSSQLYCDNKFQVGSTFNKRAVTDAILVYPKKEIPDPSPTGNCTMKLFGSAARLRDNVVNGTIKTTIPNGAEFEVIGLYSWKASDGYRWGYGKYNGVEGYFQYDPAVMMPQGRNLNILNYKMRLAGSAARIRTYPVGGDVLTVVPDGSDIVLMEFGKIKESDGYQWFQGKFNGITGFLQYDPAVMFPTND